MAKKYKNTLERAQKFDPYGKDVTREELLQIRRQLAKVMNQRMVRLENARSPVTGEDYTFGSYDKMQDYLEKAGRQKMANREGGLRFAETLNVDMSNKQLIKEIKALQGYSEHVSSTVAGMHKIEKKRQATFKAKGLDPKVVSSKDFYDFLNTQTFDRISNILNSDMVNEEVNRVAKEGVPMDQIIDAIDKYLDTAEDVSVKGLRDQLGMTKLEWEKSGASDAENPFT